MSKVIRRVAVRSVSLFFPVIFGLHPATALTVEQMRAYMRDNVCPGDLSEHAVYTLEEYCGKDASKRLSYNEFMECHRKYVKANETIRDYNGWVKRCKQSGRRGHENSGSSRGRGSDGGGYSNSGHGTGSESSADRLARIEACHQQQRDCFARRGCGDLHDDNALHSCALNCCRESLPCYYKLGGTPTCGH